MSRDVTMVRQLVALLSIFVLRGRIDTTWARVVFWGKTAEGGAEVILIVPLRTNRTGRRLRKSSRLKEQTRRVLGRCDAVYCGTEI